MKRRRVIVGVVFVVVAAGLGWLVMRETRVHTFTLPDGSHLFLRRVTMGSNVTMNFGSAFDKMLARVPGKPGARFRRNVWKDESDKEMLVFWFEYERARVPDSIVDIEFIDPERYRKYHTQSWLPVQTLPNGRMIASCAFLKWPRNELTLTLRVLVEEPASPGVGEGKGVGIGELTVNNPGYRP